VPTHRHGTGPEGGWAWSEQIEWGVEPPQQVGRKFGEQSGYTHAPLHSVEWNMIWRQLARDTIKREDLKPDATSLYVWRNLRYIVILLPIGISICLNTTTTPNWVLDPLLSEAVWAGLWHGPPGRYGFFENK